MGRKNITVKDVAAVLDHSLLRPDIIMNELKEGCALAAEYQCISVCVRPSDVPKACEFLKGTGVLVTTVIGFPHGTCTKETKVFEIRDAVAKGAVEVDMVMNIGRFLSGEYDYVEEEIKEAAQAAHEGGAILKVIFENYYLDEEGIIRACALTKRAGADFVKSSTGYAKGGAVLSDMQVMVDHADGMQVKAAGGIRTLEDCLALMSIGVVRCGTRASREILKEAKAREEAGTLYLEN